MVLMHVAVKINSLFAFYYNFNQIIRRKKCLFSFKVLGTDGTSEVGAIHKKYRGFIAEAMSSADQFAIRCKIDRANISQKCFFFIYF